MSTRRAIALFAVSALAASTSAVACSSGSSAPEDAGIEHDAKAPSDVTSEKSRRDAPVEDGGLDSPIGEAGTPSLIQLSVSGPGSLTLMPPFSSGVHDYYVRCAAGSNRLSVSMTASKGAESLVLEPKASTAAPKQTLSETVNEGEAIVAAAREGSTTVEYWVRCLPHDFPELQMVAHGDAGVPTPGYYLVGNASVVTSGEGSYGMVLDARGVPVWYQVAPAGVIGVSDVENPKPEVIAQSFFGAPWSIHQLSPLIAATHLPKMPWAQHELVRLGNGHYVVTTAPTVTPVDLTGISLPLPDGGVEALGPGSTMLSCDVLELDSMGNTVWTWKAADHMDPVLADVWRVAAKGVVAPDGGIVADPYHCNSIDVDPAAGNLLVSGRDMDSVFYIERSTGRILWKMGGDTHTKDNAAYVPVTDKFYTQHDARLHGWISTCTSQSGQISMFDDETGSPGVARGVVYEVSVNLAGVDAGAGGDCGVAGGDAGASGATKIWEYASTYRSTGSGSFRILADGSRVIGWGLLTGSPLTFTEVDSKGNDLLDFSFANGEWSYRALKVPTSAFDISVLRSTAGLPP